MSLGPIDIKRAVQDRKSDVFNTLRNNASALNVARRIKKNLKSWSPGTREGTGNDVELSNKYGRSIGGLVNWFDNNHSAALDTICYDDFELVYQLHYDIARTAVFGVNTMTVHVPVSWRKCDVEAVGYAGPLKTIMTREKLSSAARSGIPDRDQVAKDTGWSRTAVRNIPDDMMSTLQNLVENVSVGQSKMTRLVKGFLLLLEVQERGDLGMRVNAPLSILYEPMAVLNSYRQGDRAYVYNSKPDSEAHTMVLQLMGGAYPPPMLNSHVTIPADGQQVVMVAKGQLPQNGRLVTLTPQLIYASIMTYAIDVSCTGELQEALLIACSLQENRYFSRVRLPIVISVDELMAPSFISENSQLNRPFITTGMAKSLGRIHQMVQFCICKDIIGASVMQTKTGFDPSASIRAYLNSNAKLVSKMAEGMAGFDIVASTASMKIYEELTVTDYTDMLNLSIFEGLWLVNSANRVVDNGILAAIIDGEKLLTNDRSSYHVLKEEMQIAGIDIEDAKMPNVAGQFTTTWVGVKVDKHKMERKPPRRVRVKAQLTRDCEFQPSMNIKAGGNKARHSASKKSDTKSVVINLRTSPKSSKNSNELPEYFSPTSSHLGEIEVDEETEQAMRDEMADLGEGEGRYLTAKQIAEEARAKVVGDSMSKLRDALAGARTTELVTLLGADHPQLTQDESINMMINKEKGSLSVKERDEWKKVLHDSWDCVEGSANLDAAVGAIAASGKAPRYLLTGNNKYAKAYNKVVEMRHPDLCSDPLDRLKAKGSGWSGDIRTIPKEGLPYIANSRPWLDWLGKVGIGGSEMLGCGKEKGGKIGASRYVLADVIAKQPNLDIDDVRPLFNLLRGKRYNLLPEGASREMIRQEYTNMEWKVEPTSLSIRREHKDDSQWLFMASRYNMEFDVELLKVLCGTFFVPQEVRSELRRNYGLF